MGRNRNSRSAEMRRLLANEAARLIAEDGVPDFLQAKRKAAFRYGVSERDSGLPTNQEIETALIEYRRLFQAESHPQELRRLRLAARQAMLLFGDFQPRLVGGVLRGDAGRHSTVQLHLFVDAPERVVMHLIDRDIPFDTTERRIRQVSGESGSVPAYRFVAGEIAIEAAVFAPDDIRQAPASPVDGKPMKRANIAELESLLDE